MKQTTKQPSFFRAFLQQPLIIGAVRPSSRFLARAMTNAVPLSDAKYIIELGAGTGVITKAILQQMHPRARLLVFETNPRFSTWLQQSLHDPRVTIIPRSAEDMPRVLEQQGIMHADYIFSGLPFQAFEPAETRAILHATRASMHRGSALVAFQYTTFQEPTLKAFFNWVECIKRVWLNTPPARVYVCRI